MRNGEGRSMIPLFLFSLLWACLSALMLLGGLWWAAEDPSQGQPYAYLSAFSPQVLSW